ncbi:MAG: TIGR03936 family radical SAM-associated protein [Clostridia bacterium]
MRMIVIFEKGTELRYIGHLDLMRLMQRALRRSGLPIQYSNGFNPHIRLSFAAPLSVGVVGLRELMEVPLIEAVAPDAFITAMNQVLPSCLQIKACKPMQEDTQTLMALVGGSRYTIRFGHGANEDAAIQKFDAFMSLPEYMATRKTKSGENPCDIRAFVKSAHVENTNEAYAIHMETICTAAGALKPSLWLECLCEFAQVEPFSRVIYRDAILSAKKDGTLVPLEEL